MRLNSVLASALSRLAAYPRAGVSVVLPHVLYGIAQEGKTSTRDDADGRSWIHLAKMLMGGSGRLEN